MPFKVVYLTGAPGVGKSTLANELGAKSERVKVFNYGSAMVDSIAARRSSNRPPSVEELRRDTYAVVGRDDIKAVNAALAAWISEHRNDSHLIIDTHQVALDQSGLIALTFSQDELGSFLADEVWVISTSVETAISRISRDPNGRNIPSPRIAGLHATLQENLALYYSSVWHCYFRILDGEISRELLVETAETYLNGYR